MTLIKALKKRNKTSSISDTNGSTSNPHHVAIIMDGNGRWAKKNRVSTLAGHRQGATALRQCVITAIQASVPYLTVFGFSSENWKRPGGEIKALMGLLRMYIREEMDTLKKHGIRLRVIGRRDRFDTDIVRIISSTEKETRNNRDIHLTIALDYGGRQDIIDAAQHIAEKARKGEVKPEDIDESMFSSFLSTASLPDPDFMIRTSGEIRISNFLLWQSAYCEMYFTPKLWPDFSGEDLLLALEEFRNRERRYGGRTQS